MDDAKWINLAQKYAIQAYGMDEVPVGAVIVKDNELISTGFNQPIHNCDPTAHAEIIAIRNAAKHLENYRLMNTTLYVTLEPCIMCVGAILQARISRVVYALPDSKFGAVQSLFHCLDIPDLTHRVKYELSEGGEASKNLLQSFFKEKRKK